MIEINSTTPITGIMHRHVATTDVATSARECARRIAGEHIGCIIVVRNGRPAGIVTERSFVDLVKKGTVNPDGITAADIMSSPLITLRSEADFAGAMEVFNKRGIKRLPVVKRGRIIGLLSLKDMIEFSNLMLANLEEKHRTLTKKASIDALTGVYNKHAITLAIQKEYERIQRYGGRSSILFVDIDHFKKVNDTYTHLAGDEVLRSLGALLQKVCRQVDVTGRFGGEEFVILAPNRKKYHAVIFGERVRQAVEAHRFTYKKTPIKITVSVGIASLFEGRGAEDALERADKALYHAKQSGRNRVGLWRDGKLAIATDTAV
jgi:diguanylate cyclase (GGDEF)-like protein